MTLGTAVVMLLAASGPAAMANVNNSVGNRDDLFRNDLFRNDLFDDNNNNQLDTINVGPLQCLVDENDVLFCVNEQTGQIVHV